MEYINRCDDIVIKITKAEEKNEEFCNKSIIISQAIIILSQLFVMITVIVC